MTDILMVLCFLAGLLLGGHIGYRFHKHLQLQANRKLAAQYGSLLYCPEDIMNWRIPLASESEKEKP